MSPFCPPMQAGGRWDEVTHGGELKGFTDCRLSQRWGRSQL